METKNAKHAGESIFFYTFHKCASTLFSSFILKNIENLEHVNYASQMYTGNNIDKLSFEPNGFAYGPIRLSADPNSAVYNKLVKPVTEIDFVRNITAVFFIRDPRDIIVSLYYSLAYSHGFSPVKEIEAKQKQIREKVQSMTIDEYALDTAQNISNNFIKLNELSKACDRKVIIKYEDMINNWEFFAKNLCKYINIRPDILNQIYIKSRPRKKEDIMSHQRSGKTEGFRDKLKKDTIKSLNHSFKDILKIFNYKE